MRSQFAIFTAAVMLLFVSGSDAFAQYSSQTLMVTKSGTGSGRVMSSPGGINCGSTCSASFGYGAYVMLSAMPDPGSVFSGWSGYCSGMGGCYMYMYGPYSVNAQFSTAPPPVTLTVNKSGAGAGTVVSSPPGINCGSTCSASFAYGSYIMLSASAATGSVFSGWSGACTGMMSCYFTLTTPQTVSASFAVAPASMNLGVYKTGTGSGNVSSIPGGISCGAVCSASFTTGTMVTLVATADNGSTFSGWSGDCAGSADCTVTLDAPKSAFASFNAGAGNHTALWWNPSESGWGINFNHQGDIVFGTLFTYDASGNPMWLVMSNGARQSGETFMGTLYRTTGPAFNADPFTPIGAANLSTVGTMSVTFTGDSAALLYSVNGVSVAKGLQKQVYGMRAADCQSTTSDRASATNYQDLWWNAAESGWGVNVTHQGDILFATLFTYDTTGQGLWLVMSAGTRQTDGSYLGDLYRTTGPAFNANPFTPIGPSNLRTVGTMQFRFSSGIAGTLTYTVDGITVTKAITRQVFAAAVPACS